MTVPASAPGRPGAPEATNVAEPSEHRLVVKPGWIASLITVVVGALATLALVLVTQHTYLTNQRRLLDLRSRDAASLIIEAIPTTQTPLVAGASVANTVIGGTARFRSSFSGLVGTGSSHPFVSVSLWDLDALARGPVAVVGVAPHITGVGPDAAYLRRAAAHRTVTIRGLLQDRQPRLGYAVGDGARSRYVVYAEKLVPADRRSRFQSSTAFAGLGYAIYLGHPSPADLIVTNAAFPPLRGTTATQRIPYGQSTLTLVMSASSSLAGWLPQTLPWIIAGLGSLLTLAATALVTSTSLRRRAAERLAGDFQMRWGRSSRLAAEQRSISQTLQQALLPTLPDVPGLEANARYEAGGLGIDVGGDWYDLIERPSGRVLMVVGDVSGQGLRAATTMAALRHAIHAYAQLDEPAAKILSRLSGLIDVRERGEFATVLFAEIDIAGREIALSTAGHLPALLLTGADATFLSVAKGPPVGVDRAPVYPTTAIGVPPGSTLVAFTDGLVERRGELLDVGLERLQQAARRGPQALPELLEALVSELVTGPVHDDTAILGVRWTI